MESQKNSKVPLETEHSHLNEQQTRRVVYLTAAMMLVEIGFGYVTNSMALLADGWHMASHVFAIGITWIAYIISRKYAESEKFSFAQKKLLALSGFTSAVVLQIVAVLMAYESVIRLFNPLPIRFGEAIFVAILGLIVNAVCAFFLHGNHDHDHNIRSAYWHVLADGLTSVTAILALSAGMFYNLYALDSLSGIISSIIITKWAIDLISGSGKELIDFSETQKSATTAEAEIVNTVIKNRRSIYPNQYDAGKKVPDEIIWQILENANRAPNHKQTEPWRFSVFTGKGLRFFGELQQKIYKENAGESFSEARHKKLLEYPLLSSHVIAIGMKRSEKDLPELEEIEAVACAVENMFLSVTAYGLGSYWSSAGITYIEAAKPYFNLGPDDKLLGFFYIGYVARPYTKDGKRRPIQEKVNWQDSNLSSKPDIASNIKKENIS